MGSKFVVADPGLCIGCETCMAGCILKHSVPGDVEKPRLKLVKTLTVSAPIVCHQCVDAPCVAACPEGALYFGEDRVAMDQSRCIGCRSCILACPYGAVQIDPIKGVAMMGSVPLESTQEAFIVKCDLCYDRDGGPVCVSVCPTNSLTVADEEELMERQQKRRVKAAVASSAFSSVPLNSNL